MRIVLSPPAVAIKLVKGHLQENEMISLDMRERERKRQPVPFDVIDRLGMVATDGAHTFPYRIDIIRRTDA